MSHHVIASHREGYISNAIVQLSVKRAQVQRPEQQLLSPREAKGQREYISVYAILRTAREDVSKTEQTIRLENLHYHAFPVPLPSIEVSERNERRQQYFSYHWQETNLQRKVLKPIVSSLGGIDGFI